MQNGGELSPSPVSIARLRPPSRPALEHDSESDRNVFHLTTVRGLQAIVPRFDEGLEARQRKVDTSARIPAEVVLGGGRDAWGRNCRHIESSAGDQIGRKAGYRQTIHDVARRAHDAELGATSCFRAEGVIRAIDPKTDRDDWQVDRQRNGAVVAGLGGVGQVAHGERATTSYTKLEGLQCAELRV